MLEQNIAQTGGNSECGVTSLDSAKLHNCAASLAPAGSKMAGLAGDRVCPVKWEEKWFIFWRIFRTSESKMNETRTFRKTRNISRLQWLVNLWPGPGFGWSFRESVDYLSRSLRRYSKSVKIQPIPFQILWNLLNFASLPFSDLVIILFTLKFSCFV